MANKQPGAENILTLIAQGMGSDLHWYPEAVGAGVMAETLVAMANSGGGQVLLGVSPRNGKVQGVADVNTAVDTVFQAALLAEPVLVLPVPVAQPAARTQVLVITVPPGLPNVYNVGGRYLTREGRHNQPFSARKLRELLVARGVLQFESRPIPDASLNDLDEAQVAAYLAHLDRPQADWQQFLLQRGCLAMEGKKLRPTYAAILLFGKQPQRWLPNATILAARFPGVSFADEFIKSDISGTLPTQLQAAEQFLRQHIKMVVRMVGLTHTETPEVPYEAVRELLVNAVAHRDYNVQGDNIHLYLFADRLEVSSPGTLPGPVTLDNLLVARYSRNAVIVQVLSDLGFVERLGYGLNRVVTAMKQNGLKPPYFQETGGAFRVTLYGQPFPLKAVPDLSPFRGLELNPRQKRALDYLSQNSRITSSDFQELCPDVHTETLRRDFADLVDKGVLIRMGDKRATYYILKASKRRKS